MNIWVVGENNEKAERWGNLLANYFPSSTVINQTHSLSYLKKTLSTDDFIFCLTVQFDKDIQSIVDLSIAIGVPILCVAEDINKVTYDKLLKNGIKGPLNSNISSLDTIKTAMRIVRGGGMYIESPIKNDFQSRQQVVDLLGRPSLDMEEWKVFSLTAKGLKIEEITTLLAISKEDVLKHQENIVEKTSCNKFNDGIVEN